MNNGLQELRKLGYDVIANEIEDGLKRWDDKLKRERTGLTEGYLKGYYGLHIHFTARLENNSRVSEGYCIYLQLDGLRDDNAGSEHRGIATPRTDAETSPAPHLGAGREYTVLVDPIQLVQSPQRMGPEVKSVVRLQPLDDGLCSGAHATDFLTFHVWGHCARLDDREFGPANLVGGHAGGVFDCQGHRQMVECGSPVEKAVSDNQHQAIGDRVGARDAKPSVATATEVEDWVRRGLWVWLVNDSIGVCFDPRLGLLLEGLEVFACPIQLESEARGSHDSSPV
jgi:hypothetical protein